MSRSGTESSCQPHSLCGRVGRIAEVFSQMHQGKPLVRRAKIAVTKYDSKNDLYKVEHIYRDISRIAPIGGLGQ